MANPGKIEYVADTEEVVPGKMEIGGLHDNVSKIEIETTKTQLIMRFHTIDVFDEDDESLLYNLAIRAMTSLAFNIDFSISNLRKGGATLPKKEGGLSTVICCRMDAIIGAPRKTVSAEHEMYIRSSLNQDEYVTGLQHQFVIARSEADRVSRFMFLYNLALQLSGDEQKKLDQKILKIEPECLKSCSPKSGKNETIYTRLRNQIAHHRKDSDLETSKKEIGLIVGKFQTNVKQILQNQLNP